jgi:hypothetical protein
MGLRRKKGTKRGHCQQNLGLEITASVYCFSSEKLKTVD